MYLKDFPTITNRAFTNELLNSDNLLNITLEWIRENLYQEDVFSKFSLEEWARSNGYIEEE